MSSREEAGLTGRLFGSALYIALSVWFCYVAVEPFARRWWPKSLISWSRLLQGRALDPMIGRDILVGLVGGMIVAAATHLTAIVPSSVGLDTPLPIVTWINGLSSLWEVASALVDRLASVAVRAAALMAMLVLSRGLLRNQTAAIATTILIAGAGSLQFVTGPIGLRVLVLLVMAPVSLILLFRFGLLAVAAETWVILLAYQIPLTVDPSSWYFGRSLFVLLLIRNGNPRSIIAHGSGERA